MSGENTSLQRKIGYTFHRPELLEIALCHSSYVNEHRKRGIRAGDGGCMELGTKTPLKNFLKNFKKTLYKPVCMCYYHLANNNRYR